MAFGPKFKLKQNIEFFSFFKFSNLKKTTGLNKFHFIHSIQIFLNGHLYG